MIWRPGQGISLKDVVVWCLVLLNYSVEIFDTPLKFTPNPFAPLHSVVLIIITKEIRNGIWGRNSHGSMRIS